MNFQISRVAFIDKVHAVLQQKLEQHGVTCLDFTSFSRNEVESNIHNVDGIVIRSKFKVNEALLKNAHQLKFIARSGSGMENIDLHAAKKRGIALFNSPEGNRTAVSEHALGMLLALFHKLILADGSVRNGAWKREAHRGIELTGRTIGIIGFGNTGSEFAKRLRGFEVDILAYDKYKTRYGNDDVKESTWEEIEHHADIISLHVPLTDETKYLINKERIHRFRKPVVIINTSRGNILNTKDLLDGLKHGKIWGACLDVLEYEKASFSLASNDSKDFSELTKLPNVVFSPHVAGWTHESYYKLSDVLYQKIARRFFGKS
jgi:D-3-phosphoglycerate dehydrogenase